MRDADVNVTDPSAGTTAVAVCGPTAGPSVRFVRAMPLLLVTLVAGSTLPPPDATAQLTVTPWTGALASFRTTTASESVSACPASPACASPACALIDVGTTGGVAPSLQVDVNVRARTAQRRAGRGRGFTVGPGKGAEVRRSDQPPIPVTASLCWPGSAVITASQPVPVTRNPAIHAVRDRSREWNPEDPRDPFAPRQNREQLLHGGRPLPRRAAGSDELHARGVCFHQ